MWRNAVPQELQRGIAQLRVGEDLHEGSATGRCASFNAESGELLAFLDELAVCGKQLHSAGFGALADGLNMVHSRENLHDEDRFRRGLAPPFGDSVRLLDAIGAVSAIGAGINTSHKNVRRGSAALATEGIEPCGLSTSSFRISWLLPDATVPDAVRALHRIFIEEAAHPVP